jgi:hypothetical protein
MSWGTELRALVFLTISGTVGLAITAGPVARLLGVRMPSRDTVAILGAQGLGLALAEELRSAGLPVVFLDANPQNCRIAEEAGFSVVYGNALQERTQQRARFGGVGSVVGLTSNQMLNSVFVSRARDRFRVPHGYIAGAQLESGLAPDLVRSEEIRILFEGPVDLERWDVAARHGDLEVEHWKYRGDAPEDEPEPSGELLAAVREEYVLLCVKRGNRVFPMYSDLQLEAGDIAGVAINRETRAAAHEVLRARRFEPAPRHDPEPPESA